jgi:hypothetical protein
VSDFEADPLLFDVETPLGFRVHCTEEYWKRKVLADHDNMADMLEDVIQALVEPDEVRVSSSDPDVLLFYVMGTKRFVCAVARDAEGGGFLITAYTTDSMKRGATIWTR